MPYFKKLFSSAVFSPFFFNSVLHILEKVYGKQQKSLQLLNKTWGDRNRELSNEEDNSRKNSWWSRLCVSVCAGCWETKRIRSGFWPWETQRQEDNHCKVYEDSLFSTLVLYDSRLTPTPLLYLPFLPFFSRFLFFILSLC